MVARGQRFEGVCKGFALPAVAAVRGADFAPQTGPIVAIVGPTAAGKSRLAMALAEEVGAHIVCADSRQVYRYMDVGTAKPTAADRAAVPHWMLDVVAPNEAYSVQQYRDEAGRVLRRIAGAGRTALVVGGTGFYVRALLEGTCLPPVPPDPELRKRLWAELDSLGPEGLHDRLARLDPRSAVRIDRRNAARVIRALEINLTSGAPVPDALTSRRLGALYLGVTVPRAMLRRIADDRVWAQVQGGLVEETQALLDMGYDPESPALSGFGYRQMVEYLNGDLALDEAVRLYQTATHQYIRRQMTWFRRQPRIRWLEGTPSPVEQARALVTDYVRHLERRTP